MKIFISYRRDDSAGHAGRVHDRLASEFGRDLLFMDVDAIPLGLNFVKILGEQVAQCDVLLALIGPNWTSADEQGKPRLDSTADFVRVEIAAALQRDIPVIPILLEGARIPRADQLPDDLKELAFRNGLEVRHGSFHSDMDKLVRSLRGRSGQVNVFPSPAPDVEVRAGMAARPIEAPASAREARVEARGRVEPGRPQTGPVAAEVARKTDVDEAPQTAGTPARDKSPRAGNLPLVIGLAATFGGVLALAVVIGLQLQAPTPAPQTSSPPLQPVAQAPQQPAAPGTACSGDKTLLQDDFSRESAFWDGLSPNFEVKGGSALVRGEVTKGYPVLNREALLDDADICLTVTPVDDASDGTVGGLLFWAPDKNNFHLLAVTNGQFKIDRITNNTTWSPLQDWRATNIIVRGINKPNQLRLTIHGQDLSVAINGTAIAKLRASPPAARTYIGLYGQSGATQSTWKFNALKVTNLR